MAVRGYQLSALPTAPNIDMNIRPAAADAISRGFFRGMEAGAKARQMFDERKLEKLDAELLAADDADAVMDRSGRLRGQLQARVDRRTLQGMTSEAAKLDLAERRQKAELSELQSLLGGGQLDQETIGKLTPLQQRALPSLLALEEQRKQELATKLELDQLRLDKERQTAAQANVNLAKLTCRQSVCRGHG